MTDRQTERGLALVSVLWGVSILSLIAAAMLTASVTSAHVGRNVWNATRGGSVADAAVAKGILSLLDDRAPPRVDGTPAAISFDGLAARLWLQDESGRINLNFATKDLLQGLFVSAGVAEGEAGALADRIVKLREPQTQGGPPPPLAFRSVDELLAVPGMSRALFARIVPALTVYGRGGAINQAVAPREVLRALPNMDEQAIAELLKERDEARRISNAASGTLATPQSVFLVTAEVHVGGARIVRVAAVQFTGDAARPYLIVGWR